MLVNRSKLAGLAYGILLVSCASIDNGCDGTTFACFVAGTLIDTPDGRIAIEELKVGDAIVSVDPATNRKATTRIENIEVTEVNEYIDLRTANGVRVGVTRHHPLWAADASSFVPVGDLNVDRGVGTWVNGNVSIDRIIETQTVKRPIEVYHLVVDRAPHTFVAEGLIVHNKPPRTPPMTNVALRVSPANSGWIASHGRFFGQGRDTLFFGPVGGTVELEAVPRVGWVFDHWNGDVSRTDTFVTYLGIRDSAWAECVFDTMLSP